MEVSRQKVIKIGGYFYGFLQSFASQEVLKVNELLVGQREAILAWLYRFLQNVEVVQL